MPTFCMDTKRGDNISTIVNISTIQHPLELLTKKDRTTSTSFARRYESARLALGSSKLVPGPAAGVNRVFLLKDENPAAGGGLAPPVRWSTGKVSVDLGTA